MIQVLDAIQRWRTRTRWCAQCKDRPVDEGGSWCSETCATLYRDIHAW